MFEMNRTACLIEVVDVDRNNCTAGDIRCCMHCSDRDNCAASVTQCETKNCTSRIALRGTADCSIASSEPFERIVVIKEHEIMHLALTREQLEWLVGRAEADVDSMFETDQDKQFVEELHQHLSEHLEH